MIELLKNRFNNLKDKCLALKEILTIEDYLCCISGVIILIALLMYFINIYLFVYIALFCLVLVSFTFGVCFAHNRAFDKLFGIETEVLDSPVSPISKKDEKIIPKHIKSTSDLSNDDDDKGFKDDVLDELNLDENLRKQLINERK